MCQFWKNLPTHQSRSSLIIFSNEIEMHWLIMWIISFSLLWITHSWLWFFFFSPHIFLFLDGKDNIRVDRTCPRFTKWYFWSIAGADEENDQPIFKESDGIVQQTEGKILISKHKIRSFYLCTMHQFAAFEMAATEMHIFHHSLIFQGLQYLTQERCEHDICIDSFQKSHLESFCTEDIKDAVYIIQWEVLSWTLFLEYYFLL